MTPPDISNAEGLSAGPTVPSFSRMLSSSELRKMSAVDRRQGSELGYVHLGSRKGKGGNQRIILNSTDGIGRFLIRVPCEVEETGDLVIEPIRLSSLLDKRQEDELVVFAQDKTSNRVVARCGSAKVTMVSAGKSATFESNIKDFPHTAE